VLERYRTQASLTERELADWLGIDLAVLADLTEEPQPLLISQDGAILQEMGLDQLAEVYGTDRTRLLEAFDRGDP